MTCIAQSEEVLAGLQLPPESHLARVVISEARRMSGRTVGITGKRAHASCGALARSLRGMRRRHGGAVIAEFKRASPSLGGFADGVSLEARLASYRGGGAAAVSILAEPTWFHGSAEDVRRGTTFGLPVLYKGFVVSEGHLEEASAAGASAVLLIARVLREHTAAFAALARETYGLEPLVEVHDMQDVPWARAARPELVGINARDLSTFALARPVAAPWREAFPEALLIRESGLRTPHDVREAFDAGFDAVLVGEALMRSDDPRGFLEDCRLPPVPGRLLAKVCGVRSAAQAHDALTSGADMIGFVHHPPSPRHCADIAGAARVVRDRAVLVVVSDAVEEIVALAGRVGISHVQPHMSPDVRAGAIPELRNRGLQILLPWADRAGQDRVAADLYVWEPDPAVTGVPGGAGVPHSGRHRPPGPYLLAGGLRGDTLADRILRLEGVDRSLLHGVDAASGLERAPGVADPELVHKYVEAAHDLCV